MSNGAEECCALGICCPALSARPQRALAKILEDAIGKERLTCDEAADIVLQMFDLAPKGSLVALKETIADFARAHEHT